MNMLIREMLINKVSDSCRIPAHCMQYRTYSGPQGVRGCRPPSTNRRLIPLMRDAKYQKRIENTFLRVGE